MGLAELLEFLKSLGQGLPLAFAHPHLRDNRVDIDAVVDQGDLLGRVLLLDGEEIYLVRLDTWFKFELVCFFIGDRKWSDALELLWVILGLLIGLRHGADTDHFGLLAFIL